MIRLQSRNAFFHLLRFQILPESLDHPRKHLTLAGGDDTAAHRLQDCRHCLRGILRGFQLWKV